MLKRAIAITLLSSSLVFADATTKPTTNPTMSSSTTQPSTQPSAAKKKFVTPAELARQMQEQTQTVEKMLQVAHFDLNEAFREKPASFSFFGEPSPTLRDLIARIEKAGDDATIKAAVFYIGAGTGLNFSQAQEVRDAIAELRRAGKKSFVYADSYDTTSYIVASGATNICLMQGGEIFIPGIGFETMFYKGAFDKLGIAADYVQIGEYKGAEEPFTRSEPSEELKGEMNKLVEAYYQQIVNGISLNRNLKSEDVKRAIDGAIVSGKQAESLGWVDHLVDADGLRGLMKEELGDEINLVHNFGSAEREAIDLSNPFTLLAALNKRETPSEKPKVAIVYADGTIIDGKGGEGMFGGSSVGSEDIRQAMRMAARDDSIKAIVIRISSPGGSALASEAMWQSVRRVAKDKPVVISVGGMAASGGYYLASAGDWIVADPSAIVGSIGVVGGKFVMTDLYEKLGISTMTFSRGQNADLFSSTSRFDEKQKRMVRTWMKNTYDQFTDRITTTRGKKIKDIDKIARGRIFLAADAKDLGMVDEIGGLKTAISNAAGRAKLGEASNYDVTILPPPTTFADILSGRGADAKLPFTPRIEISADSILRSLPLDLRESLGQQLNLMSILQDRPVALMSPYVIRMK